jgi:uncharacterized protein (UPF0548 family)
VARRIGFAGQCPLQKARFLAVEYGVKCVPLPFLFKRDYRSTCIGYGETSFAHARQAFEQWVMFDLGWVRVANPSARIVEGEIVAVEACTLGLWTLNLSQILEVITNRFRYGFVYGTTAIHVEEGEERFLLALDPLTGQVTYSLEAVSRPRNTLARVGYPITRSYQHQFARDSQRRMQRSVEDHAAKGEQAEHES